MPFGAAHTDAHIDSPRARAPCCSHRPRVARACRGRRSRSMCSTPTTILTRTLGARARRAQGSRATG
eukprot:7355208-Prymnesium_polylepis.1